MLPSSPQVPPRGWVEVSAIAVGAPPVKAAVISLPRAKNATRVPSGEKNGCWAPSLSGTTLGPGHALALIALAYLLVAAGAVCSLTIALLLSTLTDSSLTAATIAIAVFTVLTVLNAFSAFDFMKPYTYSAYRLAFVDLFRSPIYWQPIRRALVDYGVTVGALLLAAWAVFGRKDVLT